MEKLTRAVTQESLRDALRHQVTACCRSQADETAVADAKPVCWTAGIPEEELPRLTIDAGFRSLMKS